MSLLKDFQDPPNEYRFAPFWFWNHELKADELERQILEMKDRGMGGFIMHARHGLLTPYMGRQWMEAVEHCAKVAQREKMWAWLYDEDNWPSGTVGMRLAREHPEYRMSQLRISDRADLRRGETIDREIKIDDELFCVLAVPMAGGEAQFGKEKNITRRVKDGRLKYTAAREQETVAVFSRVYFRLAFCDGYLDTLNRQACAWFIAETHERYAAALGKHLGRSVKGIFTDEPSTWYAHYSASVQFTDELPRRFEKQHSMPFVRALPALFMAAGPQTTRIRLDFHETVKAMYIEAFFKPMYEWCEKRKMRFIGHIHQEGELAGQVKQNLDYFATAQHMHYAGIDTLCDLTFDADIGPMHLNNHLACKFASSAEHLLEKERTMAEAFGAAAGWQLTLPTLKRLGDFQAACGVNYFMPHAAYYSLAGFRKWECPPDHSYHLSYWPFYRVFADHLARLSAALHGGTHLAPVALLSPVASMAAAFDPNPGARQAWLERDRENPQAKTIETALAQTAEALSRHQFDFDLVNEEMLERGRVNVEGELEIRGRRGKVLERYRCLVLPHATVLSHKTVETLEHWAREGLTVLFVETLPAQSAEQGADADLAERVRRMAETIETVGRTTLADDAFIRELRDRVEPDLDLGGVRDVVYLMKDKEDRRLVLLANTSRERGYERLKVRVRACGVPHLMDTRTGQVRWLEPTVQEDEWTELELDLPPSGSQLLMFAKRRQSGEAIGPRLASVESSRMTLAREWQFDAEGGNYFPLRRWHLDIRGSGPPEHWLSSFGKTYRTEFHAAISPSRAILLADGLFDQAMYVNNIRPEARVLLNGHELTDWQEGTHYDRLVPETDVTNFIRQGKNELVIKTSSTFRPSLNLDQVLYLSGDFTVAGQGEHEVLSISRSMVQTGSWAQQGFPYFSGIGRYEQAFDVPRELAEQRLFLDFERVAHVVQVHINGQEASVLPWPPYSLEVTGLIKPGRNRIVLRVANAMANLFHLKAEPSGLLGRVTLVAKRPVA
ncbi:MAG: hypothetical protein JXL80_06475 [Planctomycetes bacterium]|nr:hypothetical protein [Planctomycetota bacterium]